MANMETPHGNNPGVVFGKLNYILMISGLLALIIGFALMSGGGSENPADFNPEIFSFRRITLAPLVVLAGFLAIGIGIMRKK
jgi:hypothetical protein